MNLDTQLRLKNKISVIGSVSDFTYKWSLNAGLSEEDALRLALAVDELVTDVVLFAFGEEVAEFDIAFQWSPSSVEIIVHELGEPFDPERHCYDRDRALATGNFEGAGFKLIEHLVDEFIFLNKGRAGKEFRLVKHNTGEHIAEILLQDPLDDPIPSTTASDYVVTPITAADAEDVAKLIYRTYGYTYIKEELYYPNKIELALERDEKFGVIARTRKGEAVGYFAVLRTTDSRIGEVGEAVVSVGHRRLGVMTMMLQALIQMSQERKLLGLFGEAITVHTISQRVNSKFNFCSTALLLGAFPSAIYKGLDERYQQDVSIIIDFLPFHTGKTLTRYLPEAYAPLLRDLYHTLGLRVRAGTPRLLPLREATDLDLKISFEYRHALFIVRDYGEDFEERIAWKLHSLHMKDIRSFYIDLPLHHPGTPAVINLLWAFGFVFSGLMPLFHQQRDYLRLQRITRKLNFDEIYVHSHMAERIKARIQEELAWNITELETP